VWTFFGTRVGASATYSYFEREEGRAQRVEAQIRTFLTALRVEKGLSENTVHAYRRDICKFGEFVAARKLGVRDIQRADVVDFLASL
jgi:integrase/recombinase XerD